MKNVHSILQKFKIKSLNASFASPKPKDTQLNDKL